MKQKVLAVAIRFRWIWVGRFDKKTLKKDALVAIRFRWIWVGRTIETSFGVFDITVAIRFRWIWVGRKIVAPGSFQILRRNPLSLDMGWKKFSKSCKDLL